MNNRADPITLDPDAESADIKAPVHKCIAEIDPVRKQIERDQDEINELNAETREILAELKPQKAVASQPLMDTATWFHRKTT